MSTADELAIALAQQAEGFRSAPYLCPACIPSIGFGFTHYLDGRQVTLLDPPMTREAAVNMLAKLIRRKYLPQTLLMCPQLQTAGQLAAVTDLGYNIGLSALRSSTLRQRIMKRLFDQMAVQFRRWTKAGGRVLPGLVIRREAEISCMNTHTEKTNGEGESEDT